MARLKSHGRELLRMECEADETKMKPDSLTTWNCRTRAYMSDGTVLEKFDVRFKPDTYEPHGRFYSYGWKLQAKKKPDVSMQQYEQMVRNLEIKSKTGQFKCWKLVSGGMPPVIIPQSRILRAIESDEQMGFCRECGAEQSPVEPDARNYRCESCGAMAVYGAEEFLVA